MKVNVQRDYTIRVLEMIEDWRSGNEISKELGISRTAVWKAISKLKEVGYEIEARKGRGYKLVKKPEISAYEISLILNRKASSLVEEVYYFKEIDSTNERAKEINRSNILVFAETQTAGKGRLGRRWFSSYGGLYFSIVLRPKLSIEHIPKLTLTVGLAVCEALNDLKLDARIKWPNDVLIDGKKVCGILCELVGEVESPLAIVGIGLNVKNKVPRNLNATSIVEYRNLGLLDVFEKVIEKFSLRYEMLVRGKWNEIRKMWIERSDTIGKEVLIKIGRETYSGRATDLDEDGGLILDGKLKVYSGECFYQN